jgi:hypothetical protein
MSLSRFYPAMYSKEAKVFWFFFATAQDGRQT